jgi:hypothetical protein
MGLQKFNMDKFSFSELCSNGNGKTSGTGTAGLYIVAIGGLCFLIGCIAKVFVADVSDIITQSILFTTTGATLLGYRKSKDSGIYQLEKNQPLTEIPVVSINDQITDSVTSGDSSVNSDVTSDQDTASSDGAKPLNS